MKYVIEIPDEVKWIQYIQQTEHGTQNLKVESMYNLTPYTESDEREIRKRIINEVCNKFLENNYYYGDDIKQVLWRMKDGEVVGMAESSKLDEIRHKVEQEVWEFARKITVPTTYGNGISIPLNDLDKIYGTCSIGNIMNDNSYSEAKAKYEEWRKQKDEIHEYDEIISEVSDNKATIVRIDGWGRWHCINADGSFMVEINQQDCWKKTGRSFPELGDVLKKMREE